MDPAGVSTLSISLFVFEKILAALDSFVATMERYSEEINCNQEILAHRDQWLQQQDQMLQNLISLPLEHNRHPLRYPVSSWSECGARAEAGQIE